MKNFCEDLFFFIWRALALVSLVLGLGLELSCPWPRECLSSERLSLALASDFFCVLGLGLGLEPCVLDSTSGHKLGLLHLYETTLCIIPLPFTYVMDYGINFATKAILSLEICVA